MHNSWVPLSNRVIVACCRCFLDNHFLILYIVLCAIDLQHRQSTGRHAYWKSDIMMCYLIKCGARTRWNCLSHGLRSYYNITEHLPFGLNHFHVYSCMLNALRCHTLWHRIKNPDQVHSTMHISIKCVHYSVLLRGVQPPLSSFLTSQCSGHHGLQSQKPGQCGYYKPWDKKDPDKVFFFFFLLPKCFKMTEALETVLKS